MFHLISSQRYPVCSLTRILYFSCGVDPPQHFDSGSALDAFSSKQYIGFLLVWFTAVLRDCDKFSLRREAVELPDTRREVEVDGHLSLTPFEDRAC